MATKTATKTAKKKAAKKHPRPMRVDYLKTYGRPVADLRLDEQEFRVSLIRPGKSPLVIDRYVESFEVRDEGAQSGINITPVMRGTLNLRKPQIGTPGFGVRIERGSVVRFEVKWGGKYVEVWRMRIGKPSDGLDGTLQHEMADDLSIVAESYASFKFKKGKRRKAGWLYHEIVREVCRQFRIPVGQVVKGTKRMELSDSDTTPLDIIRRAAEKESTYSGRRLIVLWRYDPQTKRSGLNVLPMRRNPFLYLFRDLITAATLSDRMVDRATAVIGTGSSKARHGRKKVRVKVVSREGVRRYGYIQKSVRLAGSVESTGEAREKAKRALVKALKTRPVIEDFEHPGIAFLRRGDAIRVSLPDEGLNVGFGKLKKKARWDDPAKVKGIVFVTSVVHSVAPGDYTMTLTLAFHDPMDPNDIRKEKEAAARARKRGSRGKKKKK